LNGEADASFLRRIREATPQATFITDWAALVVAGI
jgi:hypothetical protein